VGGGIVFDGSAPTAPDPAGLNAMLDFWADTTVLAASNVSVHLGVERPVTEPVNVAYSHHADDISSTLRHDETVVTGFVGLHPGGGRIRPVILFGGGLAFSSYDLTFRSVNTASPGSPFFRSPPVLESDSRQSEIAPALIVGLELTGDTGGRATWTTRTQVRFTTHNFQATADGIGGVVVSLGGGVQFRLR
jgi:hypothetical protein